MTIAEKVKAANKKKPAKPKAPPPPETVGENVPDGTYVSPEEDKNRIILKYLEKVHNPMSAIRAFCVCCMAGYLSEIRQCPSNKENATQGEPWCPLWEFREGKNPYHSRKAKPKQEEDSE